MPSIRIISLTFLPLFALFHPKFLHCSMANPVDVDAITPKLPCCMCYSPIQTRCGDTLMCCSTGYECVRWDFFGHVCYDKETGDFFMPDGSHGKMPMMSGDQNEGDEKYEEAILVNNVQETHLDEAGLKARGNPDEGNVSYWYTKTMTKTVDFPQTQTIQDGNHSKTCKCHDDGVQTTSPTISIPEGFEGPHKTQSTTHPDTSKKSNETETIPGLDTSVPHHTLPQLPSQIGPIEPPSITPPSTTLEVTHFTVITTNSPYTPTVSPSSVPKTSSTDQFTPINRKPSTSVTNGPNTPTPDPGENGAPHSMLVPTGTLFCLILAIATFLA